MAAFADFELRFGWYVLKINLFTLIGKLIKSTCKNYTLRNLKPKLVLNHKLQKTFVLRNLKPKPVLNHKLQANFVVEEYLLIYQGFTRRNHG